MPSRRDLLGAGTSSDGRRSGVRWGRVGSFLAGAALVGGYLLADPFRHVPDWAAAGFVTAPVGCLLYALTGQSWSTSAGIATAVGTGIAVSTYLSPVGVQLVP